MESDGSIRLDRMFCPANDRNVPILFRHGRPQLESSEGYGPGKPVSCLDFGFRCTGWLCPHFAVPEMPGEGLLELALKSERENPRRGTADREAILERALWENREAGGQSSMTRVRYHQ